MAGEAPVYGAAGTIKSVLKCTAEEAEQVRAVLAGVMQHRHTRAFLAITLHLSNTTRTVKGTRDDFLINEGKRQFGLFLSSCARSGLDLDLYNTAEPEPPAQFRAHYRNPAGADE